MTIPYTNGDTRSPKQIARDIQIILDWSIDHPSIFECDCDAYMESDTGAWVHQENKCSAYIEDHFDIVLRSIMAYFQEQAEGHNP